MPKTLLLADDSVVIQKLVALSFANEDVSLVTVYNGDEAVEKARECQPDVVLADVVMPGKNGYEVCEAIRQDPKLAHVPVLLLTGTFEAFDEERAAQAGSNGHITKPFEAQALVERVNELLAGAPAPAAPAAAAPQAPAAAPATAPAAAGADEAYDFFDDELSVAPSAAEAPPAAAQEPADDVFAFGGHDTPDLEPLSGDDADDLDLEVGGDHTIAMMDDAPSLDTGRDPLAGMSDDDDAGGRTITASGLPGTPQAANEDAGVSFGSRVTAPDQEPADPSATVLADEAFDSSGAGAPGGTPGREAFASEWDAGESAPGRTADPDDLFASSPGADLAAADDESDLEFHFDSGRAPTEPVPPELDLASNAGLALPLPEAELDPAGSSAYDVSISDLGDSFSLDEPPEVPRPAPPQPAAGPEAMPTPPPLAGGATATPAPARFTGAAEAPPTPTASHEAPGPQDAPVHTAGPTDEPADEEHAWPVHESPGPEIPTAGEDSFASLASDPAADAAAAAPGAAGRPEPLPDEADDDHAPTLEAEPIPATAAGAHLSDVMRDRVHETLEKVAWEAFADLSDTIVRQVLERVEQVAWEVIPQMAETLIQDEIRKIKGEDEA